MLPTQPETILQFGTGRFLRAFADLFVQHANDAGQNVGRIVAVQSTESDRARLLTERNGVYHVLIQGKFRGEIVDRVERCASVSRALVAATEWDAVLEVARSPELKLILSNTTEAGYALEEDDTPEAALPRSFPAKLLLVLYARFQSGNAPLTILPCELQEQNATRLRAIVVGLAERWNLPADFRAWVADSCFWRNTLVDRIVVDAAPTHPLAAEDKLLISAEPFALWAVEPAPNAPPLFTHPALIEAPVEPYFLRKVRILNGAHTALAPRALARGFQTVREAIADPELYAWLRRLLFEEIIPVLEGRCEEPAVFAEEVLERFANPFLEHRLANILVYHEQKILVRLAPTHAEYVAQFGRVPPLLEEVLRTPVP